MSQDGDASELSSVKRAGIAVHDRLLGAYNWLRRDEHYIAPTDDDGFATTQAHAAIPSSINDHLPHLYVEALRADPSTIVELGVRGGESTTAFTGVARRTGASLISVDVDDCRDATDYEEWHFVQEDDIAFARRFSEWCADNGIDPAVDVLFIDTSHLYEHTLRELKVWFPHLGDRATIIFHDTNMSRYFRREDGTVGKGWDNDRGVIRAIETWFDCEFDETERFRTVLGGFVVEHEPHCSGLTVLVKLGESE